MKPATKQVEELGENPAFSGIEITVETLKKSIEVLNKIFTATGLRKETKPKWKQLYRLVVTENNKIDEKLKIINEAHPIKEEVEEISTENLAAYEAINQKFDLLSKETVQLPIKQFKPFDLGTLDLTIVELNQLDWLINE